MRGVKESIEALSMPSDANIDRCAEPFTNPAKRSELDAVDLTGFDLGYQLPRYSNLLREVHLSPSSADPQRAKGGTYPGGIHRRRMIGATYPSINATVVAPTENPTPM